MGKKNNPRIWEIDFLRGIAILLMISFHLFYDLNEFFGYNINYQQGVINLIGDLSAIMFILLTAISCSFSKNNFKRALKILFYSLLITLFTYIYDKSNYINFGILHFLSICIFLYHFFNKLNSYSLLLIGSFIILLGKTISKITTTSNIFLPFGITNPNYTSLDYYPLVPYLGIFIYGIIIGKVFYNKKKSILNCNLPESPINLLGRHSLIIYLIHQPVILTIVFLLKNLI